MGLCRPKLVERTLYRGQSRDHGVVLASVWRKVWQARETATRRVLPLAERYLGGGLGQGDFEAELAAIAADAEPAPSLHRFLQGEAGRLLVGNLMRQLRDSFGPRWRLRIFRAQLAELETALLLRYQTYLFNETWDPFMKELFPKSLRRLAEVLLTFYDGHRESFDVEYRIGQVTTDFLGLLQHYGVLGTPGLDLTADLDVALWFATHRYESEAGRYEPLPAEDWEQGVVYEARVPVLLWTEKERVAAVEQPPEFAVVDLANLSPLLVRPARQHGYYAVHGTLGWERTIDYREAFAMTKRSVADYGSPAAVAERLLAKGLTQASLFPAREVDPFKAHLASHDVEAFL